MHSDAQRQQLSSAFKETLLFGGRLLSSQEGMWPREPEEMYFPFCGHRSRELTAALTADELGALQHNPSRTCPSPSSQLSCSRAAAATKDESLAGTSCWSREEGED